MFYNALLFSELLKYGEKPCVIHRDTGRDDLVYSYRDIVTTAKGFNDLLVKLKLKPHQKFALMFVDSPTLITLILRSTCKKNTAFDLVSAVNRLYCSILNHNCSFCPVDVNSKLEKISNCLKGYGATYLLCSTVISDAMHELELLNKLEVLKEKVFLYKFRTVDDDLHPILLSYSIKTSGSTSVPKVVHVPYSSIVPNIENLSQIYSATSEDVVLVASPPTFDPFVVEIFLALRNGATLLMVPKQTRCCPRVLADLIFPEKGTGATIVQMTPSVFKLFGPEIIQQKIFDKKSSLRILVLGGEPFPDLKEIKLWQNWKEPSRKRILNIYGITEVSCWSSIEEITSDTKEVSLGRPIDPSTVLEVRDLVSNQPVYEGSGELFIGSSIRKCVLGDESCELLLRTDEKIFRSTGDIAAITKNGRILYKGRKDDVIKKFGHQINLYKIGRCFSDLDGVEEALCVFRRRMNTLILFYSGKYLKGSQSFKFLRERLDGHEIPDDIIHLDALPLSAHGKVSKNKLLALYDAKKVNNAVPEKSQEIFKTLCSKILGRENYDHEVKKAKMCWDISFTAAGGTSFKALQLCRELEELTGKCNSTMLLMLLNEDCVLNDIIKRIEEENTNLTAIEIASTEMHSDKKPSKPTEINRFKNQQELHLYVSWKYDMGKCVDASPIAENSIVSVGSHSHLLVNLKVDGGQFVSSLKLPDRIESPVEFIQEPYAVVGCYNGFIYKYNTKNGALAWSFDSKGMIKCKALATSSEIIFGNYAKDENLFCLDSETGTLIWSLNISSKGIFSSPTKLDDAKVVVCCLDGTTAVIESKTGKIFWRKQFSFPIFATCTVIGQYIAVAEVNGLIRFLDFAGHEVSTFKSEGPIFSSFKIIHCYEDKYVIVFGCHDKHLYCIEVKKGIPCLKWKTSLPSPIFATPTKMVVNECSWIVACSTNGFLTVVHPEMGLIVSQLEIDGEIFSSPCCVDSKIIVGCRDNHLYCIEMNVINKI